MALPSEEGAKESRPAIVLDRYTLIVPPGEQSSSG